MVYLYFLLLKQTCIKFKNLKDQCSCWLWFFKKLVVKSPIFKWVFVSICVREKKRDTDRDKDRDCRYKGGNSLSPGIMKMQMLPDPSLTSGSLQRLGWPQSLSDVALSTLTYVYIAKSTGLFFQTIFFKGLFQLAVSDDYPDWDSLIMLVIAW